MFPFFEQLRWKTRTGQVEGCEKFIEMKWAEDLTELCKVLKETGISGVGKSLEAVSYDETTAMPFWQEASCSLFCLRGPSSPDGETNFFRINLHKCLVRKITPTHERSMASGSPNGRRTTRSPRSPLRLRVKTKKTSGQRTSLLSPSL